MRDRGERSGTALTAIRRRLQDGNARDAVIYAVALAAAVFAVTVWPWPAPGGVLLSGALVGGRVGLVALGIALIYRANRVVNFAQGDLGALPAMLVVLLVIDSGLNYWLGAAVGLAAAIVLGIAVETLIIRRFFKAPRLILTVATIGLAQVLTGATLFLPRAFGETLAETRLDPPFSARFQVGSTFFNANDVITMIVIPICFLALAVWLRWSNIGVAVRASAERADRAATLGIPVRRLHTIVWTVATVLAFVAMFLRAGAVGLPVGTVLPFTFLVQALAAAVIGRFERFVVIGVAAVTLGVIDQAMTFQPGNRPAFNDGVLFLIVLGALLVVYRPSRRRVDAEQVSTWEAAREVRPIPRELAHLPEVRLLRWGLGLAVLTFLLTLPLWLSPSRMNFAGIVVIFGIIALSLVVLTGWAGQVSLGQMAFVAVGAAIGGGLTDRAGFDLSLAMIISGAAGSVIAIIIGFPALRRRGLTLAVSTLAFALATSSYLLNRELFDDTYLPSFRIERPDLFGVIDISTDTRFYFLCLAVLGLSIMVVRSVRRSRTGRVLVGIRENDRAVRSYGVDSTRTTLAGFALSGFLAALAGSLYVHQQLGLQNPTYAPEQSLKVFTMVVIGGLGSIPGALLGATYVQGVDYYLPRQWQFLATGAGLLLVLMVLPGGLGAVMYDIRDWILRRIAARRGLVVPSLVADRRVEEEPVPEPVLEEAEEAAREHAEISP